MSKSWKDCLKTLGVVAAIVITCAIISMYCTGCAYKGGKVTDGINLAIGLRVPGTEWNISVLDYVGGVRVAGNDATWITVSNEVAETNDYLGCVHIRRHTRMTATIQPVDSPSTNILEVAQ